MVSLSSVIISVCHSYFKRPDNVVTVNCNLPHIYLQHNTIFYVE